MAMTLEEMRAADIPALEAEKATVQEFLEAARRTKKALAAIIEEKRALQDMQKQLAAMSPSKRTALDQAIRAEAVETEEDVPTPQ
jgi:hypothetical protein